MIEHIQSLEKSLVEIRTVYHKVISTPEGKKNASYTRQGTGIIINNDGYIVTNTHIIRNAPQIIVTLSDGTTYSPKVLYVSIDHDFSIIKIDAPVLLPSVSFADSSAVRLGESIMAIGSSDFNNHSILVGNITSIIQSFSQKTIEFLEVNLNLYKGDSGGPIFNRQGQLLGMVMGKHQSRDRSSLCIASNKIREQYLLLRSNNHRQ